MANENEDDFDVEIVDDDDFDDEEGRTVSLEEHERTKRALAKANREAKKHRLRLKNLLKEGKEGNSGDDNKDGSGKDRKIERERIREEVSEAEEARWKKRVVRQGAKAALLEAGLLGDPTKLARLIDEDDVDVDEDGEITDGLEEQIEEIRNDYPDLFEDRSKERKKEKERPSLRGIDGASTGGQVRRKLSSAEKIQQQALATKRR